MRPTCVSVTIAELEHGKSRSRKINARSSAPTVACTSFTTRVDDMAHIPSPSLPHSCSPWRLRQLEIATTPSVDASLPQSTFAPTPQRHLPCPCTGFDEFASTVTTALSEAAGAVNRQASRSTFLHCVSRQGRDCTLSSLGPCALHKTSQHSHP